MVNLQNYDDEEECFRWCILKHVNPKDNHQEIISDLQDKVGQLNFQGINFPIELQDTLKFESENNLLINVLGSDERFSHLQ